MRPGWTTVRKCVENNIYVTTSEWVWNINFNLNKHSFLSIRKQPCEEWIPQEGTTKYSWNGERERERECMRMTCLWWRGLLHYTMLQPKDLEHSHACQIPPGCELFSFVSGGDEQQESCYRENITDRFQWNYSSLSLSLSFSCTLSASLSLAGKDLQGMYCCHIAVSL